MRLAAALILCLFAAPVLGQGRTQVPVEAVSDPDLSQLSDAELLDLLGQLERERERYPLRVDVFGIPLGFGVAPGVGFVTLLATNRRDRVWSGDWDGSITLGMGLGDPENGIGVTPILDITSVTPYHFGQSGKFGLKFSRNIALGGQWLGGVAVDFDNLITWGDAKVLDPEVNVAVSALRGAGDGLPMPLLITAGYGSGVSLRSTEPGWFGGIGLGVTHSLAVGAGQPGAGRG